MKTLIAIDPGAGGGIAYRMPKHSGTDPLTGFVIISTTEGAVPMPDTPHGIAHVLSEISGNVAYVECLVEDVHAMPGQGVTSMFSFGRNLGTILGVLAALKIPYRMETPQKWMKKVGGLPSDKAERKHRLKQIAQARYPHLKVTLKTADALAMLSTMEGVPHD